MHDPLPEDLSPAPFEPVHEVPTVVLQKPRRVRKGVSAIRRFIAICKKVEAGWPTTRACESEAITYAYFRQLCARRPTYERRYRKAEELRFRRRCEEAEDLIQRAAEKSWPAAAWWLERTQPHRYALRSVPREDGPEPSATIDKLTDTQLAEHLERERRIAQQAPMGLPNSNTHNASP
jgi:hypothetical protein